MMSEPKSTTVSHHKPLIPKLRVADTEADGLEWGKEGMQVRMLQSLPVRDG